jgi:hypothetical protein
MAANKVASTNARASVLFFKFINKPAFVSQQQYFKQTRTNKIFMAIKANGTILISADPETVFAYIANLENDKFWRKEINSTTMTSKAQINALAVEDSYLSKRTPSNIQNLVCIEFLENKRVVYQTIPGSRFFLKSSREVEAISTNETKMTYAIEFDKSIVKHGLGFSLPTFLIAFVANRDMKKYLRTLRSIMEKAVR